VKKKHKRGAGSGRTAGSDLLGSQAGGSNTDLPPRGVPEVASIPLPTTDLAQPSEPPVARPPDWLPPQYHPALTPDTFPLVFWDSLFTRKAFKDAENEIRQGGIASPADAFRLALQTQLARLNRKIVKAVRIAYRHAGRNVAPRGFQERLGVSYVILSCSKINPQLLPVDVSVEGLLLAIARDTIKRVME
jgi:hypothetical protein